MIVDFQQLMQPSNDDEATLAGAEEHRRLPSPALPGGAHALQDLIDATQRALISQLIARIHVQPPEFFERLVIDVLLSMGYGTERSPSAQRLGRTGDGGIDGVICLDELGFDRIHIQAKRLKPGVAVPIAAVRDFAGSLESHHAAKGVFVTTTHFSAGAAEFCARLSRRVVLIDGLRLAELMVRYNIGVDVRQCVVLKVLDDSYFALPEARMSR